MIERLKESRWFYILLSVVLAVAFWMYVRMVEDPDDTATIRNVPVELTGTSVLTSQGLAVAELSQETVDLTVEAPLSVINDLLRNRADISVTLNVSRCAEGENKVSYAPVWPAGYNWDKLYTKSQDPSNITVTVEKLYTQTFEVEFQLKGEVPGDYQMGTPAIEPSTVVVSGPVEQVSRVDKVVAVLEDEQLSERFAGDLPLKLLDSQGGLLDDLELMLSADTAYVVVPVVLQKEVALTVDVIDGGGASEDDADIRISPETVTVTGSKEDLDSLTEISLGSVNLADVVGTNVFNFPITLDPSLENVSGETHASVTVTVNGLSTAVFEVDNIRLTNIPKGYTAKPVTKVRSVTVRGRAEDLADVNASQLRIVADLSGITGVGQQPVSVKVYLDGTSSVGVIGEYTIIVDVSR